MTTNIELAISSVLQRGLAISVSNVLLAYLRILGYAPPDATDVSVPHEAVVAFEHALDKEPRATASSRAPFCPLRGLLTAVGTVGKAQAKRAAARRGVASAKGPLDPRTNPSGVILEFADCEPFDVGQHVSEIFHNTHGDFVSDCVNDGSEFLFDVSVSIFQSTSHRVHCQEDNRLAVRLREDESLLF
ncbi:hypothetical protein IEO21_06870 [Rhodonia placenta]|uniref:Uncharacterized protein n=1 Tax=Rhodonia placenta TaxID=104341 RepID=A0A8H7NZF1_9APHY|nr:hypothetical protein IEO21_06870 [Postia placenta]